MPFSWYEPMWLEGHEIAEPGKGWTMVDHGDTEMTGRFPVNPSGGVLSSNPIGASGMLRFIEAANQVRGQKPASTRSTGPVRRWPRPTAAPPNTSLWPYCAPQSPDIHPTATVPSSPGDRADGKQSSWPFSHMARPLEMLRLPPPLAKDALELPQADHSALLERDRRFDPALRSKEPMIGFASVCYFPIFAGSL